MDLDENLRSWLDAFGGPDCVARLWYFDEAGAHDGSGAAVAQTVGGEWLAREYSHCSCYGPEETMSEVFTRASRELVMRDLSMTCVEDLVARPRFWARVDGAVVPGADAEIDFAIVEGLVCAFTWMVTT